MTLLTSSSTTDRQTDRHDRRTDRQTDRRDGQAQTDRQTDRRIDRQTARQKDRQTERQTDRQTDRQTVTYAARMIDGVVNKVHTAPQPDRVIGDSAIQEEKKRGGGEKGEGQQIVERLEQTGKDDISIV
jgi:hypothetical protein